MTKKTTTMKWIKVTDQLPENNDEILIWSQTEQDKIPHREIKPMAVYYHNGFRAYSSDKCQTWLSTIKITHWMPLPKPPKK